MKVKPGVEIALMHPMLLEAILLAHEAYLEAGQEYTITSVTDSAHSANSLHYKGRAVDLRTKSLKGMTPEKMADLIRAKLDDFSRSIGFAKSPYDVVVEDDHIHVEADRIS